MYDFSEHHCDGRGGGFVYKKTSMFPLAASFSEVVFNGGQFNITINTVNKSLGICAVLFLQHEATSESKELLNRRMATRAHHCSERLCL